MGHTLTEAGSLAAPIPRAGGRLSSETSGSAVAFATAALVVTLLFWSGESKPLPALGWAAAFLCLAVHQDVTRLRIPNWLTLPAIVLAVTAAGIVGGASALLVSLFGAGTALAILFFPFASGWLGAGDVKACMVLGALWGTVHLVGALWWMLIAGGLLALVVITVRGGLGDMLRRWWSSLRFTIQCGRVVYLGAPAESASRAGLPFAVAMGLGAAAYQLWGAPWM